MAKKVPEMKNQGVANMDDEVLNEFNAGVKAKELSEAQLKGETKKAKRLKAKNENASKSNAMAGKPDYKAKAEKIANSKGKKTKKGNSKKKKNIFQRFWHWLKGIFSELKKVTWPTPKNVAKSTVVVVVVVIVFLLLLVFFDYILSGLLNLLLNGKWVNVFG